VAVGKRGLLAAAILGLVPCLLAAWSSAAHADWAACQHKPTRACLLDEAWRSDNGPLTGKDRLDVLIVTDYRNHPEYLTTADINEAKRQIASKPTSSPGLVWAYFNVAATALVAANRVEEAFDLISSLDGNMRAYALDQLTAVLIKADQLDEVPTYGRRMLADPRGLFNTAVNTLAERGKIEQALAFMALDLASNPNEEEMLAAVGIAYAKRGDTKMAARFYDKLQSELDRRAPSTLQDYDVMDLRFARICLQALRGDMEGAKAALATLPPVSGNANDRVETNRFIGYQKLVGLLLQLDRQEDAREIAKSAPERFRPVILPPAAFWDSNHGRIDDIRTILALVGDNVDPRRRGGLLRSLPVATAKSGDVASAVAAASQATDPVWHRDILFEVAQTMQ
jgi:tetratricopeptide (TPR) repeat protein